MKWNIATLTTLVALSTQMPTIAMHRKWAPEHIEIEAFSQSLSHDAQSPLSPKTLGNLYHKLHATTSTPSTKNALGFIRTLYLAHNLKSLEEAISQKTNEETAKKIIRGEYATKITADNLYITKALNMLKQNMKDALRSLGNQYVDTIMQEIEAAKE